MDDCRSICFAIAAMALCSCGGDETGAGTRYPVNGVVQKGPLILGSSVTVSELGENLVPNGKTYIVQTTDSLGDFTIPGGVGTPLVEILAQGYYVDELADALSGSPLSLRALADLRVTTTSNVNALTMLEASRIKSLIAGGQTFAAAESQAEREVLAGFGIDQSKVKDYKTFSQASLNGSTDQDAILLATSAILLSMAGSNPANLSQLLSDTAQSLADSGTVPGSFKSARVSAVSANFWPENIRANVQAYYASQGLKLTAPAFEDWLDMDNSGALPRRSGLATTFAFTPVTNALVTTQSSAEHYLSDVVTVPSIMDGPYVYVEAQNAVLLKNGIALPASKMTVQTVVGTYDIPSPYTYTYAQAGDQLQLDALSGDWGQTNSASLRIGATTQSFAVSTSPLVIEFYQGTSTAGGCAAEFAPSAALHAIPFRTNTVDFLTNASVAFRYVGVGAYPYPGTLSSLAIYSDNGGMPGQALYAATPAAVGVVGVQSAAKDRNGNTFDLSLPGSEGIFGRTSVVLQANTNYWLVVAPPGGLGGLNVVACGGAAPFSMYMIQATAGAAWTAAGIATLPMVALYQ